jgi:hypothetical protein
MGKVARRCAAVVACAGFALIALAAAQLAAARTNLGTVGGLTYTFEDSASVAPPDGGSQFTDCPDGKHIVGGGAEIGGNAGESRLNTTFPFDDDDGNSVPDDGWASHFWNDAGVSKSVDIVAVCRKGSFKYRSSAHRVMAGHARALKAKCPDGTHVSGGGVYVDGAISDVFVNSSYPYDGPDANEAPDDGWKGRDYNQSVTPHMMTVYAICGTKNLDYEIGGPVTIDFAGGVGSDVACPDSRHITGGGIRLGVAPAAEAHPVTMQLSDLADPDSIPDDRLLAVAGISDGTDASMTMYAVCK